jgi:hypothetical protein
MRGLIAAAAAGLIVTACAAGEDATSTLPPATTSTAAPTTSTTITPTTTTVQPGEVFLQVDQPLRLIVTMQQFFVTGTTTPGSTVAVGDVETTADAEGLPAAFFQIPVALEPGTSELIVVASDESGAQATAFLSITYLPEATEEFAYLMEVGPDEVVADYAEFLTGEEANQAAVAAGVIEEGDSVPNGYFIRNVNPRLRTLALDDPPVVVLPTAETGPVTEVAVPFEEWLARFDDGKSWPEGQSPPDDRFFFPAAEGTPYWLTIQDGIVVQIRQQYLP